MVASLYRIFLRMTVDAFIVLSESSVKQTVVLNPWLQRLPYRVIPHGHYRGIYPDTLREEARRRLGLRTDERVILWFGKIKRYKGLPELIAAFREVRLSNVRLLVVGCNEGALTEEMLREMKADPKNPEPIRFIEEEETLSSSNRAISASCLTRRSSIPARRSWPCRFPSLTRDRITCHRGPEERGRSGLGVDVPRSNHSQGDRGRHRALRKVPIVADGSARQV